MPTAVKPKTQKVVTVSPTSFVFNLIYYDAANGSSFDIDGTAQSAVVLSDIGSTTNAPSLANSSTQVGMKTVTVASDANGVSGDIWVITKHPGQVASSKV